MSTNQSVQNRSAGNTDPAESHRPPEAPAMRREWKFYGYQYVAIPLFLLIPLLALLGVFGESTETIEVRGQGLEISAEYSNRAHYEAYNLIRVIVRNESDEVVSGAVVEFDRELLDHFSQLSVNPGLTEITGSAYRVELGDIERGGERTVTLDYQPDMNGAQRGQVSLVADGITPLQAEMAIFVFP